MRSLHRLAFAATATALTTGAAILLMFVGAPTGEAVGEFCGLAFAAVLVSAYAIPRSGAKAGAMMPPPFVFTFAVLLLFGGDAAILVAVATAVTSAFVQWRLSHPIRRLVVNAATIIAMLVAAIVYQVLGDPKSSLGWSWRLVSIADAVVAYWIVTSASTDLFLAVLAKRPIDRAWPKSLLSGGPSYAIGAAIALGLVGTIDYRAWQVLVVAAFPLFWLYRAYSEHLNRHADDGRRREVIESLGEGMCVVDAGGRVILWNDALEQIARCPRDRALGSRLEDAVPALAHTGLRQALDDASASRSARTVVVTVPQGALGALGTSAASLSASGPRILDVKVLPVEDGLTLLWHDATDRARAEGALKRNEDRLALAAEGANDGWWEWDLRSQELYVSRRWRALVGLTGMSAGTVPPQEWTDRVHPEDIGPLKEAIKAHLAGTTDHLHHECRMRHEDGSYRRFLCHGLAARDADRRAVRIAGSLTDTTDAAVAQERLRSVELVDPLTGLRNRSVFVERVGRRLDDMKQRRARGWFAVLYLDLDRFKVVNDSLGHLVGDELLIGVSRRLESCLQPEDALARLGGDEFAILLDRLEEPEQPTLSRSAFRRRSARHFQWTAAKCSRPRASASRSVWPITEVPTTSCATPTRRCTTRKRAASRGTSCSTRSCTHARARVSKSRTTSAVQSKTTISKCTTSLSCCWRQVCASGSSPSCDGPITAKRSRPRYSCRSSRSWGSSSRWVRGCSRPRAARSRTGSGGFQPRGSTASR
jgi:diguanylate cyclase (GGDEF)-like protein/PAS domain S-box-containing protein